MGCISSKLNVGGGAAGSKLTSNDENAVTRRASLMKGSIEHTEDSNTVEHISPLAAGHPLADNGADRRSTRCYLVQTLWFDKLGDHLSFND